MRDDYERGVWDRKAPSREALRESRDRDTLRCRDCYRLHGEGGCVVEKRETWNIFPRHRGEVWKKPTYCDTCWDRRARYAPDEPPVPPLRDDHEPTHEGEQCLDCGAYGLVPVDALGTRSEGVVVYLCPKCGAEMDDWSLEDYRYEPEGDAPYEGETCICCGEAAVKADPPVRVAPDGPIPLYHCPECGNVVSDDDLWAWRWDAESDRAVAR